MSWASQYIQVLQSGKTCQFRPVGHSMTGRINHKDLVTVTPIIEELQVDDVVLVKVKGAVYLHLIKAMQGDRLLIGNNRGGVNGWTTKKQVFGKVVKIEK